MDMNLASLGHCADADADAGHLMNLRLIRSKQGFMHDLSQPGPESDFYFVQSDGPKIAMARMIDLVKTENPRAVGPRFGRLCPADRRDRQARACSDEIDAVRRVGKGGQDFCRIGTVRVPPCPREEA